MVGEELTSKVTVVWSLPVSTVAMTIAMLTVVLEVSVAVATLLKAVVV